MELSKLQKKIIYTTKDKVIVLSSAASGKTTILTERVKFLLDCGADPEKIVMFTFTNAAAEEMRKRIGEKGRKCFINTVHSYAYQLLIKNGIDTGDAINEEDFDLFFKLIEEHPEVIEEVEYLLLDEAQDSNSLQYQFILKMIHPKNLFIVGDLRQSIYGFNDSCPELLLDLTYDPEFFVYDLNENYRNAKNILNFAKRLISGSMLGDYELFDDSICMREDQLGFVSEIEYSTREIVKIIMSEGYYKDWFVLTRKNSQIDTIMAVLKRADIPCDTFKRGQLTSSEFIEKMNNNSVKVLTVHAAKGLEANNVVVIGVSKWSRNPEERRIAYVAATRARNKLFWTRTPTTKKKFFKF